MNDLLLLENPALCLGIYVENPLEYMSMQSNGRVLRMTRRETGNLKITTSHKRKLVNMEGLDKVEQSYKDNMRIIREISFNDRVILDYVDINKSHLPIFITNPSPGFILSERCKMQVLYHFSCPTRKSSKGRNSRKNIVKSPIQKPTSFKDFSNQRSLSFMYDQAKFKLNQSQDNFFFFLDSLKEKAIHRFSEQFKNIEREKNTIINNTSLGFKLKP
jgi:hypothetical protein